jgi:hypothetical protein
MQQSVWKEDSRNAVHVCTDPNKEIESISPIDSEWETNLAEGILFRGRESASARNVTSLISIETFHHLLRVMTHLSYKDMRKDGLFT